MLIPLTQDRRHRLAQHRFPWANFFHAVVLTLFLDVTATLTAESTSDDQIVRVFIFAGQSNMVGSDSKVKDIGRFPPFKGLENPQTNVRFSYCIGRENKMRSEGWVALQPVDNVVGPELSFARKVTQTLNVPLAIIKVAAGGTHLGGIGIRIIHQAGKCTLY